MTLAGVAAALVASGPSAAAAASNQGRPLAVLTQSAGADDVLFVGAGGHLWENVYAGGQWQSPFDTGLGPAASSPAVTRGLVPSLETANHGGR